MFYIKYHISSGKHFPKWQQQASINSCGTQVTKTPQKGKSTTTDMGRLLSHQLLDGGLQYQRLKFPFSATLQKLESFFPRPFAVMISLSIANWDGIFQSGMPEKKSLYFGGPQIIRLPGLCSEGIWDSSTEFALCCLLAKSNNTELFSMEKECWLDS